MKQIKTYIERLQTTLKNTKNSTILAYIEQQLHNLSYVTEDLFICRLQKMINFIINNKIIKTELLCIEELRLLGSLNKIIESYLNNIHGISLGQIPQQITNNDLSEDYLLIRFLKEIPQIIGTDLKKYGPFLVDDIAILPKKNAEALLKHQAGVLIMRRQK
ncbi:MAG: hypothetical protein EU536_01900 [Promethearchaeota archaeon]|nr:MAG: hypothetical protein EU536_01900 [Candidatus Lokiarchaeota archaeon]